jgi:tetratricopeptide (TPR) repeat protein
MSLIRGYDQESLRERVDLDECAARLAEIEEQRSLPALLERVWLLKVLGRLDDALALADEAVRQARMAGTRKDVLRARVLHATILQYRGAHAAAEQELATCAAEAEGQRWLSIAAFAYQHHGKNAYDAEEYETARESFKQSLFLRRESGAEDRELETVLLAIEAVERRRPAQLVAG